MGSYFTSLELTRYCCPWIELLREVASPDFKLLNDCDSQFCAQQNPHSADANTARVGLETMDPIPDTQWPCNQQIV